MGSHTPDKREVDGETVARATVFVDVLESAHNEAGDLLVAAQEGVFSMDNVRGEIGELASGKVQGRQSADEVTLYKSLGAFVQDLYGAWAAYSTAKQSGVGTSLAS